MIGMGFWGTLELDCHHRSKMPVISKTWPWRIGSTATRPWAKERQSLPFDPSRMGFHKQLHAGEVW